MFSTVILTLNEERNLPACLASIAGCDDIVVLDSGSTDRTADIARAAGARVFVNPFHNFAQQRNHASDTIDFRHDWVFHLDADETFTPALLDEIRVRLATDDLQLIDGYYIAPRMIFRGRWIPHCTDYPAWQARLIHRKRFRFVQAGHGQREAPDMRMGRLRENYHHNLSSESEETIAQKLARYARSEAAHAAATCRPPRQLLRALLSRDALARRRALKELSYRLPARGAIRFIYQYLLRRGFLDGSPGLAYCRLLAGYERESARELRRLRKIS
ncbi:glycosyltransferase family 2 protein [Geminisphaera colitermitum]|uniref:glycosyltransferase family 2 protein n=1 Tax=Geminisphaera colitermitum TaxID=1148786 RepID=UPI000158D5E2|nr:glycosyltransferase family 2 protein [Geminisphaera colitermitum]